MINGKSLLDYIHPIGTYYIADDGEHPAEKFYKLCGYGGTWDTIAENATIPLGSNVPVVGNGNSLGIQSSRDIWQLASDNNATMRASYPNNSANIVPSGTGIAQGNLSSDSLITFGLSQKAERSGIIADLSQASSRIEGVYIYRRAEDPVE